MAERSTQCPVCRFEFARLVDAGGYRAYHCAACDWTKPTTDTRPGNRPADVCALCDTAISPLTVGSDHHLYVGPGMVFGGGREHIPVHGSCLSVTHFPEGCPAYEIAAAQITDRLKPAPTDDIEPDTCRPVKVDGEVIRVHGSGEMDETDREHFAEIVRAAKALYRRNNPTQQGETSR